MANLSWDHDYDTNATAVLYRAADAGNTTALQTLRARDARAILRRNHRLAVRMIGRGRFTADFANIMAERIGQAVDRMNMRDAHAGEYARQHAAHAFRTGGTDALMAVMAHYGARAASLAEVRTSTVESLARKFCNA